MATPGSGLSLRQPFPISTTDRSVVLVKLNETTINNIQACVASGEKLTLHAGDSPYLEYGKSTLNLKVTLEQFRHEIYAASKTAPSRLELHNLVKQRVDGRLIKADLALEKLAASLGAYAQEKAAKHATFQPGILNPDKPQGLSKSHSRKLAHDFKSLSSKSPDVTTTRDDANKAMLEAKRKVFLHLLAVKPMSDGEISRITHVNKQDQDSLLQKIAAFDKATGLWSVRDRLYKEARVWDFDYKTSEDREAAIDNIIRAYDRIRISINDQLWQFLLPKEDRNKGICLSRLHAAAHGTNQIAQSRRLNTNVGSATPLPRSSTLGSSTPRSGGSNAKPSPVSALGRKPPPAKSPKSSIARQTPGSGKSPTSASAQPMSRQNSATGSNSKGLDALLKFAKKQTTRVIKTPNTEAGKRTKVTKAVAAATMTSTSSKVKSAEYIVDSDEDALTSSSKSSPATSVNAVSQDERSAAASGPAALKGAAAPKKSSDDSANGSSKSASPISASACASGANKLVASKVAQKLTIKKEYLRLDRSPTSTSTRIEKRQVAAATARNKLSPNSRDAKLLVASRSPAIAASANKDAAPKIVRKRVIPPEPDYQGTARPSKISNVASGSTPSANDSKGIASSAKKSAPSTQTPQSLKRKVESLSKGTYDDEDRVRAKKQARADSSSVTSGATASSSSTTGSIVTTARTSIASPAWSPTSTNGSNTATQQQEQARLSWERALDEAERFQTKFYPAYIELFDRIEAKPQQDVKPEERKQLLEMHDRLKQMKKDFAFACHMKETVGC